MTRINDGARQLPWTIGEWGIYALPSTLDDAGVTLAQITRDAITVGVKTQNLVGITLWNNSNGEMSDLNDPNREKRNAWRDAINLLPVSGVTIP